MEQEYEYNPLNELKQNKVLCGTGVCDRHSPPSLRKVIQLFPGGKPLCILFVHVWVQIWPTQFIKKKKKWNLESSLFYTVIDIYFELELIKCLLFGLMFDNCMFASYRRWSRSCHHTSWMNSGLSLLSKPPPPHPHTHTHIWPAHGDTVPVVFTLCLVWTLHSSRVCHSFIRLNYWDCKLSVGNAPVCCGCWHCLL